jgi:lactobin A/cerein 7B family class IIb bacteriocin
MEKMNLNAYGVMEMNQQEMVNVEGGSLESVLGICLLGLMYGAFILCAIL